MMGVAIAAMGAAALLVFKKMVKQYVEVGDMVHKMALRTGFAAETLSELAYAADISGADLTMLEKGVKKMSKTIVDASYGLETYLRVFRSLGLEIDDLLAMKPEEQFLTLGAAIAEMESDTLRTAAAVDIFGRAGTMLLPLFKEGAEGIAKLREEAHRLGIIFDEEMAAKAAALKDAQTALTGSVKGLSIAILTDLIPIITNVVKHLTDWFVETRKGAKTWAISFIKFFKVIALGVESLLLAFQGFRFGAFKIGEEIAKFFIDILEPIETLMVDLYTKYPKLMEGGLVTVANAISDLTTIQFSYNDAATETAEKMAKIIVDFDKFKKSLEDVITNIENGATSIKTALVPALVELKSTVKEPIKLPPFAIMLPKMSLEDLRKYIKNWQKEQVEKWEAQWQEVMNLSQYFIGELTNIFGLYYSNMMKEIDNEYEQRKVAIEKSMMDEEEKAKAMERLDAYTEKRRKAVMRSQAKAEKATSLIGAIVNTAMAVTKALTAGPFAGPVLAAIVGALGAAQIALIAAAPLPSLQRGGRIEEAGIVGERGAELFMPERPGAIIPLRTEAGTLALRPAITMTFLGPLIATTGVARADLEKAGNDLLDIMEMQARRRGYTLNGS